METQILDIVDREDYERGQVIFPEGTAEDRIYVVLSGSVEISKKANNRKHIIELLEEGDLFGRTGFLGLKEMQTTATALGKTEVGIVKQASLDNEFNQLSPQLRIVLRAMFKSCNKVIDRASDFTSRKHPRSQKVLSLSYEDHNGFRKAYTGNISQGGLFIRTKSPLQKGEAFLLKLKLPGIANTLKIGCNVVWTRKPGENAKQPPGMGVKFGKLDSEDHTVLTQYLKTILGQAR